MAAPSSEIAVGIRLHQHFYAATPLLYGTAGATIVEGDVLKRTSGLLGLAAHDEDADLLGVSMGSGTAAGAQVIPYIPFWPGTIWEITASHDGTAATAIAASNNLVGYGFGLDAGNSKPYLNLAETTLVALKIIGFRADVVAGTTTFARVYVRPVDTKICWGVT